MDDHGLDAEVIVVGAGPTGCTVAGLLARAGVSVLVLERHAQVYALPRAVHFDDEVLRVFTGMGLGPAVRAISTPGLGMRLVDRRGSVLLELPRDPTGGSDGLPEANMFDQPELEAVLRDDLARQPLVQVRTGSEVVAVTQPGVAEVRVELADGSGLRGRYVLACDGAGSGVREGLGIGMDELGSPSTWLVVDVRTTDELDGWRGVHQVCDGHRAATFMRVGPLRYRWEFALRPGERPEDLTAPTVLAELLAPWLGGHDLTTWTLVRSTSYTFRARVAQRWSAGRVFLLGDAAHQTPPFLGQGMCAGVRDAANLSWKLAMVLSGELAPGVLDTYEQERRPHATHVIRTAVALGRVMAASGTVLGAVRAVALRGVSHVPGLAHRVATRAWPPLTPGALVHRARRSGPSAAGVLVPTPLVRTTEGDRRLDDVLGAGFTTLTAPGSQPSGVQPSGVQGQGTHLRVVQDRPTAVDEVQDLDGVLTSWFSRHRAAAVTVRPDRAVLSQR